jgi:hypothetical protein
VDLADSLGFLGGRFHDDISADVNRCFPKRSAVDVRRST